MKKYKLERTDFTTPNKRPLFRVVALRDFLDVKKGDKGGLVESESNLSQDGSCWVYYNARVYDDASVWDNARVYDGARISGNASVAGNSWVGGHTRLTGGTALTTKHYSWDIAEVENGDGTTTLYGNATFEPATGERREL